MSNEQAGIPAELTEALSENETAEKIFAALPSSHQNEYLRWIGEAKRAETVRRYLHTTGITLRPRRSTA